MTKMTTSIVLTAEQSALLKRVAGVRMLRGDAATASVSEVIRKLIEDAEPDLRREIAGGTGSETGT